MRHEPTGPEQPVAEPRPARHPDSNTLPDADRDLSVRQFPRVGFCPLSGRYYLGINPKSACSTVKYTLWAAEFAAGRIDKAPPKKKKGIHGAADAIFRRADLATLATDLAATPRVTMVRNPYTRLLSCYLEKIAGSKPPKKIALLDLGLDRNEPLSFATFVQIVARQDSRDMDAHWAPQAYLGQPRDLRYDIIGSLEAIDTDMDRILVAAGLPPRPVESYIPHRTGAGKAIDKHYTDDLIALVRTRYAEDFAAFGYSTDIGEALAPPDRANANGERVSGSDILSEPLDALTRAVAAARTGSSRKALATLRAAIETYPRVPELHVEAGEVSLDLGDLDAADRHLREAVALNGEAIRYRLLLTNCLIRRGEQSAALAVAEATRELSPGRPRVLKTLAHCHKLNGNTMMASEIEDLAERFVALKVK